MTKTDRGYRYPTALAVLAAAMLLLACSDAAGEAALEALKLCASVIVPSLFPYTVISGLIVSLGAAQMLGRAFAPLCRRLFRLPGSAAGAILLGGLCGFPIGAQTACALRKEGRLTRPQTERLIAIANNTGPAFLIEVVGAHCWGSRGFGLTVYAAQIVSALIVGTVYARICPTEDGTALGDRLPAGRRRDVLTCLAESVSTGAISVLTVCGFVVFFAVALSLMGDLMTNAGLGRLLPILAAVLEFTGGTALAAEAGGISGAFLTGFAVGWSGVSVFAQCKVFTSPLGIRLSPAAACKAVQGILTGLSAAVYYRFFFTASVRASTCIPVTDTPELLVAAEIVLLILFCLAPVLYKNRRRT